MYKYFTDKAVAKKIKNLKVNKRLSEEKLKELHYIIKDHIGCARSELRYAILAAMEVIDVNTRENDDVENMIEILIQRPDKSANEIFTFTRDLLSKIENEIN
jgi:hypothetical protein